MKMSIFISVLLVLLILVVIIFPPSTGKIPQFYDNHGKVLPNSIAEKSFLNVDDAQLGMVLLGKDVSRPVLLVCGGGPGIAQYLLEYKYPSGLTDLFTVCYLEYRGTGLSYDADIDTASLTTQQYVEDVLAVTEYLKQRFSQEKIYIMGHSFGSYVALKTVQQAPEHYTAYIAMSQICDQKESEALAYDYMKEQYSLLGNKKMAEKFVYGDIRQSEEAYDAYLSSSLRDTAMHQLGVGSTHEMRNVITGILLPSLRCTHYTPKERLTIWRGKISSSSFPVQKDALHFNAFEGVKSLQLPIYFFAGEYDYTCCYTLQKAYYQQIDAPLKRFYTFENAAHSPIYEEPEVAKKYLQEIIEAK